MRGYMAEAAGHRGENGSPLGVAIPASTATEPRKIRVPLLHSAATIDKLLPLATSSGLNFTIYLEDFKNALMKANGTDAVDYKNKKSSISFLCYRTLTINRSIITAIRPTNWL